jgi:hypothetical protein
MKAYIRQLPKEQLIELFMRTLAKEPKVVRIPLSIFSAKLSSLELIVKYLKEELGWSNKKIALTILRTPQNIWITYRNATEKYPGKLDIQETPYDIPISIFEDKRLSILESIGSYLVGKGLSYRQIANALHRDRNTVAAVYHRARNKEK